MSSRRLVCWLAAAAALSSLSVGCSSDSGIGAPDATVDAGHVAMPTDATADAHHQSAPVVVGVVPDHGSFLGGTQVAVRGSNFIDGDVVYFGTAMVQPRYTQWVDAHRITVNTPANMPGRVDVSVVAPDGVTRSNLPQAYTYDAFYVDPGTGPLTGGARVSIHGSGTHFADGMSVTFDGMACTTVHVTSPELLDCITPAHTSGSVTVVTTAGTETITVPDAYQYADTTDGTGGGLSGGALHGSLTVSVVNTMTGGPVPSAFVWLNNDPGAVPPNAGQTDARGQVTLSPPGLTAPVTVTAAAHCFTTTTIQAFNAAAATVYLTPLMLPSCGHGMGTESGQQPLLAAVIEGQLVWDGPNETAPNPWDNIPAPRMGERRIAKVYTTRADIYQRDPAPGSTPALTTSVLEVVPDPIVGPGYPFTLHARPAAVAVYCLAGIENTTSHRFTPYIMGVARNVLGSPGATVSGVYVHMNIPLSHEMPVAIHDLPMPSAGVPNTIQGDLFLDLGGEGVIPRPEISLHGVSPDQTYIFEGLPGLTGTLADARITVHFRYASGMTNGPDPFYNDPTTGQPDTPAPMTGVILQGITTPDDTLTVGNWLGIPDITTPAEGEALPADRTVRFAIPGNAPDVLELNLQWSSGSWQHLAPGAERTIQYPDVSTLMGLADLPTGTPLTLSLVGLRIPGFDFNHFTYAGLGQDYWTAYSGRAVLVTR